MLACPGLGLVLTGAYVLAEGMLGKQDYFQNGKVDKNALVSFIRDIKKNTKLTDHDAAIIAASKVHSFFSVEGKSQFFFLLIALPLRP